jgi:integrase
MVSVGSGKDRVRKSVKTYAEAVLQEKTLELCRKHEDVLPDTRTEVRMGKQNLHTLYAAYQLTVRDIWSTKRSKAYLFTSKPVIDSLGKDTPVTEITTSVIREMVSEFLEEGDSGGTINGKLSALSMMLKTAADEGWIETMPRIKRRANGDHRIRWLDAEEEMEVLNTCTKMGLHPIHDYIVCAIDTGFRRMELLNFPVSQYRGGFLHLHPDQTKTNKARAVPATKRVQEILERRRNNKILFGDLTPSRLRTKWEEVRAYLGKQDDPQFVVHMLRHTCASRLAMQDKTAQFIQAWMGHSTPITTARYMHLAPSKLIEGVDALDQYRNSHAPVLRSA